MGNKKQNERNETPTENEKLKIFDRYMRAQIFRKFFPTLKNGNQ